MSPARFRSVEFPCGVIPGDTLRVESLGDDQLFLCVRRGTDGEVPPTGDVILSAAQAMELAKRITAAFSETPVSWKDL